jgi:hypothetical protein
VPPHSKIKFQVGHWWLTSVILASQEAEIRSNVVQSQPRQIVHKTLSQKKKKITKKRADRMSQGVGPEFKLLYHKRKIKFPGVVVHTWNLSYSRSEDKSTLSLKPARAVSENLSQKQTGNKKG